MDASVNYRILSGIGGMRLSFQWNQEWVVVMGFPENFHIPDTVSDTQAYRQFGNSVIVPVVQRIATEIAKHVN